ncbi:hypothetical protein [Nonomuraea sp. NPDC049646]|uniref:hypothetical protein n=1 Tax=unclassified Nonomuraea TaxID=2593643 RepID=UPI0037B1843F
MLRIPALSKEYVPVPISGPADLSSLPVQMAVVPQGADPSSSWQTADWSDDGTAALILVGPGSTIGALTKGLTYDIWVKITSTPEIPVLGPFDLHIT